MYLKCNACAGLKINNADVTLCVHTTKSRAAAAAEEEEKAAKDAE